MPVYQYGGQHYDLPDGLSNEQAIAKIKAHLNPQNETSFAKQQSENLFNELRQRADTWEANRQGAAETGLSMLTGTLLLLDCLVWAVVQKAKWVLNKRWNA
jgi:hypothetical protein